MTIYTPSQNEKKPDKDETQPEVVTEPLTSFKDEEEGDDVEIAAKAVRVNYFQRQRRSFCIHLFLTNIVLIVLACGAIGAVVFYRHMNKKVYSGTCGNVYFDATYHKNTDGIAEPSTFGSRLSSEESMADYFEETIRVSEVDLFEELHTPAFDEVQENYVWHDFYRNVTAIVDDSFGRCYIMKLNRTAISPPKNLIDLIEKLVTGYYMPKAKVIRENYRMVRPLPPDVMPLGGQIFKKCVFYNTFWLEKIVSGVTKRSADVQTAELVYAILSNHIDHPEIFKIIVHELEEMKEPSDV